MSSARHPGINFVFTRALTFIAFYYKKDIHLIKTLYTLFNSRIRENPFCQQKYGLHFCPRLFTKRQSNQEGGNLLEEER